MDSRVIWLTVAFLLLGAGAVAAYNLIEAWYELKRWEQFHLTHQDVIELKDCVDLIHQYLEALDNIGWSMVELEPAKYGVRTEVNISVQSVQVHSRNIHIMHDKEKVDAMLAVYRKEWDETASLLLPQLRFFTHWCQKNDRKTMRAGEGSPVENNVESEESTNE